MDKDSTRRVVVTGFGVVSSIGIGWQEFWKNLLAGQSGISEIDYFDTTHYDRKLAGQVKNFHPEEFISKMRVKHLGRASQMAIAAAKMAWKDAELKKKDVGLLRAGVCIGTTMGEGQIIEKFALKSVEKQTIKSILPLTYPANAINFNIASEFSLRGHNHSFANACAAANFSIGRASDLIRSNEMDLMFAGGCDPLSRIAYTGFHRLISIAPDKCRPFDKNRAGMIPGEGCGILILEELNHALKRGANIYAEISGYGAASDAHHMTQPHPRGGIMAVQRALKDAGIKPDEVNYISAHGTGTMENDKAECQVFYHVFGERAKQIPVSSIKSMLGHTLGAASALEAIACCMAVRDGKIPPTINYETPDPECDIDCVPNISRSHPVRIALNNSLAFGGNNFAVLIQSYV
ncbi:MAG: beta-ketoacyl-[acyl-carrier-protein] synthase family protein [Candidatus Omnitrophota bacterium]